MNDIMEELVQFSQLSGALVLETVAGESNQKIEYENEVRAQAGKDRTMYLYAPKSGCPDSKQCQVLLVLRDGSDEASAQETLKKLELDRLSEEEHFIVLFPNPLESGWNHGNDPAQDSDTDFLVRCFDALKSCKAGVNGFNGMIFYLATSPAASAMLMTMATTKPVNVSAMMLSKLPASYSIPSDALHVEVAAWSGDHRATEYLLLANGATWPVETTDGVTTYLGKNPNVRLLTSECETNAEAVRLAWDRLFSQSRRWQNDTYGTYQPRTDFVARGFTAHVKDASLGVNNNFPHTWYEYVPPQLRETSEKVPLVFYFHGVNCVPLYGAEQSNLHDVADRENFIVVYPAPARSKCWNIWNESRIPSDFDFTLALIEHMKTVHPIDETRIYATGFSMGGMMTHAITGAYPEIFAAGAPCNAFNFGYLKEPAGMLAPFMKMKPEDFENVNYAKLLADEKKAKYDYRMPIFQNAGYDDATICLWPVDGSCDDARTKTIQRWKEYNNIPINPCLDPDQLSGLCADESFYIDDEERFLHQRWYSKDKGNPSLFEMVIAKRMPHAILPIQIAWAWDFLKHFSRAKDGSLIIDHTR
ncbi:MAG TPA: PHB depolymerase family esterase [Clostridia bacterium]|nr:PHB depolymerase family esterase [Clostridia bacterium]